MNVTVDLRNISGGCNSRQNNSDFTAWFVNSVILSIPILCSILWLILQALSNQIQSDQDRDIFTSFSDVGDMNS